MEFLSPDKVCAKFLVIYITVTSACDTCLEMGPQFALHVPEKALYLQADLVKDTDRMFHALQTTSKVCFTQT